MRRVRRHARPGELNRVTGVLQVRRGQANEGDEARILGIVGSHAATVHLKCPTSPHPGAPLWTTPTQGATLCIEGSDGGPLWIEPTLE